MSLRRLLVGFVVVAAGGTGCTAIGIADFHQVGDGRSHTFDIVGDAGFPQLAIAYRLPDAEGEYIRKDITVAYEHDSNRYEVVFPAHGLLCLAEQPGPCDWTSEHDDAVR